MEVGYVVDLGQVHECLPVQHLGLFDVPFQGKGPHVAGNVGLDAQVEHGPILHFVLARRQPGHAVAVGRAAALYLAIRFPPARQHAFVALGRDTLFAANEGLVIVRIGLAGAASVRARFRIRFCIRIRILLGHVRLSRPMAIRPGSIARMRVPMGCKPDRQGSNRVFPDHGRPGIGRCFRPYPLGAGRLPLPGPDPIFTALCRNAIRSGRAYARAAGKASIPRWPG
jgi:hypothetical protein